MELTKEQFNFVEQIAKKNNFLKYKTNVKPATKQGDNNMGIIVSVEISDEEKNLKFLLKSASSDTNIRRIQPIRYIFLREIFIYETIFREFEYLEKECNVSNRFTSHPSILDSCDSECFEMLAMEDMREKGYVMWNKKVPMNHEHIVAVLKKYAQFHSISLAMSKKDPNKFTNLTKDLFDVVKTNFEDGRGNDINTVFKNIYNNLYKSVENDILTLKILQKSLQQFNPNDHFDNNSSDILVVTHGDCWCNNFLFKYEGDSKDKPSDVCIVDWQYSKLGSLGFDLSYFLFANAPKDILMNYKVYMKIYYDTMVEQLKEFSCTNIITLELLLAEFKKCAISALIYCTVIMKIQMCEPNEAPVMEQNVTEYNDIINFKLDNAEVFYQRMADLVHFMIKNDML